LKLSTGTSLAVIKGINMIANILRIHACRLLLLLCLAFLAVTARAAGVKEFVIPPDSSGPQIPARLTIHGVKDCAPSSKQLPLIVISHGMFEDMFSHHDTADVR
jgi:hypothetical protein